MRHCRMVKKRLLTSLGAILEEGARFARDVLLPLNQSGDEEGCLLEGGEVKAPRGFKEAYQQYVEGGLAKPGGGS